jgi:hypothetical protein
MFTWDGDIDGRSQRSLAESVRRGFESVAAQVQTTHFKQHDRDGAHTDVTASSLVVDGPVTVGRFVHQPTPFNYGAKGPRGIVVSPDIGGTTVTTAWHFPYVERASVIIPDLSSGAATLYGLSVVARELGEEVRLVNHQSYNTDLVLRLNPSGSFDGEFAGNLSTPNVDVTVPRGRWVTLMLLALPGATALRWHVSMF